MASLIIRGSTIICFGIDELPVTGNGISIHRNTIVCWDRDRDARVLDFLDSIDPFDFDGRTLLAVHESKGCLYLLWEDGVPDRYAEGQYVSVADDSWVINSSRVCQVETRDLVPQIARKGETQGGAV